MNLFLAKIGMFLANVRPLADNEIPEGHPFAWVNDVVAVIDMVLWPLLIIVAAAGTIYAVVLGVNMARADSTEKREEAKKKVINVLVGMAIIVAIILLLKLFMNFIPKWIPGIDQAGQQG